MHSDQPSSSVPNRPVGLYSSVGLTLSLLPSLAFLMLNQMLFPVSMKVSPLLLMPSQSRQGDWKSNIYRTQATDQQINRLFCPFSSVSVGAHLSVCLPHGAQTEWILLPSSTSDGPFSRQTSGNMWQLVPFTPKIRLCITHQSTIHYWPSLVTHNPRFCHQTPRIPR